jgi:uncharacterized protein YhaN
MGDNEQLANKVPKVVDFQAELQVEQFESSRLRQLVFRRNAEIEQLHAEVSEHESRANRWMTGCQLARDDLAKTRESLLQCRNAAAAGFSLAAQHGLSDKFRAALKESGVIEGFCLIADEILNRNKP